MFTTEVLNLKKNVVQYFHNKYSLESSNIIQSACTSKFSRNRLNLHRSFNKVIQSAPFCAKSQSKDPIIAWSSRLDNNVLTFQQTFLHIGNISTSLANINHFIIIVCYIKGFRKRWFTLDGQDLTYYKAPEKTVCDKHNLMLN